MNYIALYYNTGDYQKQYWVKEDSKMKYSIKHKNNEN